MAPSPAAGANCRVLIVEDDPIIAGNLYTFLETRGFLPDTAYSGPAALQRLAEQRFDAMILDIGLPGMDGNAVLHTLRSERRLGLPVLMLTARQPGGQAGRLLPWRRRLSHKPFALLEVEARLLALIQRAKGSTVESVRAFGPLQYDTRSRAVSVNGAPVHLTRKAGLIIETLLRDPGRWCRARNWNRCCGAMSRLPRTPCAARCTCCGARSPTPVSMASKPSTVTAGACRWTARRRNENHLGRHPDPARRVGADRHRRAFRDGAGSAGLSDLRPDGRRSGQ